MDYEQGRAAADGADNCGQSRRSEGAAVQLGDRVDAVPERFPKLLAALKSLDVIYLDNGGVECIGAFGRDMIQQYSLNDNFYAFDLARLARLYQAFVAAMPRVHPHYAVKCNPDPGLLRALVALGCGFDCASAAEVDAVLAAGATPDRIVMAQACKRPVDLRSAATANVQLMTFDCEDELRKVAAAVPAAQLLLRIRADDPSADVPLGEKYGADAATEAPALLAAASRLNLAVVGVAFHIGSGSHDLDAFRRGIRLARQLFDRGAALGLRMCVLDIGGGFWGRFGSDGRVQIAEVGAAVTAALEASFPAAEWADLRVIAEPGRYFAESSGSLFTLIHTAKERADGARHYFVTDGLHGSFAPVGRGKKSVRAHILRGPGLVLPSAAQTAARVPSTVFGPTCDGWDRIMHEVPMPLLRSGDWLQVANHGAYSLARGSLFNGIVAADARRFYVWSEEPVQPGEEAVELRRGASAAGAGIAAEMPERRLCLVATPEDLGTAGA